MKKLGILVIHGIGTSSPDFDEPFRQKLFQQLKGRGHDPDTVAYRKVFWAEYLDRRQNQYLDLSLPAPNRLALMFMRKFVMTALADASSYMRKFGQSNLNYNNIIRRIYASVHELRQELAGDDKPLVIFAHSLGAFIINNFIWDAHKMHGGAQVDWPDDVKLQGKFEHMVNVAGIVTFGCNIPLFVIGNDPIIAIDFPHPELPAQFQPHVQWNNYYDPQDILGWPLKTLQYSFDGLPQPPGDRSYAQVVTRDIVFDMMDLLSWLPGKAHCGYWGHRNFIRAAADHVQKFLS